MTNIMMEINKESDKMFNTAHTYGEVSRLFVIRCKDELEPTWHLLHSSGNMHSVTYNQYLVSPTLLAGWMELREFHRLNGNHQVTLTHYGQSVFLFTIFKSNSKPKDVSSIIIVYNHDRKTAKIGNGWRTFAQTQNLLLGTQIIFEFLDETSNFVILTLFVIKVHYYSNILSICKFVFIIWYFV
ncbi:hypothetical protein HKD37_17G049069 [Glycine soja]